jgi:geranylgeranyl diphosphate synthase type II
MHMKLKSVTGLQELFLEYISQNRFARPPEELYAPVDYIMGLGGKRLRPVLLLMSYQLFDSHLTKVLPAAMAIEVFHNFTLVHDDIMDQAPLRRGMPTVHEKYNHNTGILSGDVMLIRAYQFLLAATEKHNAQAVVNIFSQVAVEVCEGQQMDMNFETAQSVSLAEYLRMIELKTAVLIAGAMKIGALLGGASETDAMHLYEFGRNIGVAFQIQDDVLDTYGDPEKFGKKQGGDILRNKKTYLLLKSFELADEETTAQLKSALLEKDDDHKIRDVIRIYDHLKVRDHAIAQKELLLREAYQHLASVNCPEEGKLQIQALAEGLMVREV